MANSTITPLQGETLLINQLELITPTTVAGTFYGIAFTLFCLNVHLLVPQLREEDRKTQTKFMLGYSSIIMLCGLYNLVFYAWLSQDAYIKHADYDGGPFEYIQSMFSYPGMVVAFICEMIIDILTSAIQVWRVWVIWSAARYGRFITVLPLLSFLAFTALALATTIIDTTLPTAQVVQLEVKAEIMSLAAQGATTILCTIFISGYLIYKQCQQRKLIGRVQGSTGYMDIVAMIVESYALESIWLLAMPVASGDSAVSSFFVESAVYIETIAYLLVQYRVASGKAYNSQRGQRHISSLRWNHSTDAMTWFEGTDEIQQSGPHVPPKREASEVPLVSSIA